MIDHFNLPVADLARSQAFYERVLAPLGYRFLLRDGLAAGLGGASSCLGSVAAGFGVDSWGFGIVVVDPPVQRIHLAFAAQSRAAVDETYRAALGAGASSNGAPGIRSDYDPSYYAAYVLDPDGHNLEFVCRS